MPRPRTASRSAEVTQLSVVSIKRFRPNAARACRCALVPLITALWAARRLGRCGGRISSDMALSFAPMSAPSL
ncbi:hypothetical protein J7412_06490 [Shimia sp. R9_3]|nr:hypothetical protein [Shimia sp. R9_3]